MKFHIGRLGRVGFIISMLGSFIILFLLFSAPFGIVMTFVLVNFAWMVLIYIGRLHDVGHSGWWALLAMCTSLLGMLALAVWPGKKEANKYGVVPPTSASHLWHFWRSVKTSASSSSSSV